MIKYNFFKKWKKRAVWSVANTAILAVLLMACSNQQKDEDSLHEDAQLSAEKNSSKKNIALEKTEQDEGSKLTEAAGPTVTQVLVDQITPVSDISMPYVGRYHTEINCEDKFAHCEKGSAEFIINLLPDGTAHRTFVYKGRVSNDSHDLANRNYKNNTWHYDPKHHQIVVQRIEEIQFFYKIDDQQNLVIDRDRILNVDDTNKKYFSVAGHHAPEKNYVMTKF